jgi:hypothetical protein
LTEEYNVTEHYDPRGEDRIRSNTSLAREQRPPSPLIPSEVSRVTDKPTYQAHRDSLLLQHPQPKHGPTARYQNQLEREAQTLRGGTGSPVSPQSDTFGSNPVLKRFSAGSANTNPHRYSGVSGMTMEAVSVAVGGPEQAQAPPRPPKIRDDGPLVPSAVGGSSVAAGGGGNGNGTGNGKKTFAERAVGVYDYDLVSFPVPSSVHIHTCTYT